MKALIALLLFGAMATTQSAPPSFYTYEIVAEYPHDTDAFTQGLFFDGGVLYESTGLYGQSTLRRVDLPSGDVIASTKLPSRFFGEGSVALNDKIIMLTYRRGVGLVFNKETLKSEEAFDYEGEGWGLTTDGEHLFASDGTDQLRIIDPATYEEIRRINVTFRGRPLKKINELEWVNGEILANIYQTNAIARIDPETGIATGMVDMRGLLEESDIRPGHTDVLNGIAYNPQTDKLYVTGKNWPKLFEINLRPRDNR
ncbi:MAG: glutaminyl-peptide cyclotransferase [Pseudomonadota bacterium]